ncbi:putative transcription factor & chromatin remodeling &Metalloenzymes JmjC family [Helianthus annuus]|nr:putative transcription factor & chromatin remodeling &Metalloenzymes JmjC family [Helianthus annuus]
MQQGGYTCSEPNKVKYSKQILHKVFPLVATLNEHQLMEKEIEAEVKGVSVSELHLQDAHCEVDDDIFCDNCGAYSFDFYRSCACGYDLCLLCCRELRDGQLKRMTIRWKARIDGSIPCPPKDIGGCNDGTLDLKRILCVNWIVNLLEKAQRVYEFNNSYDSPQTCMESDASYLYSLSAKDIQPQHMEHFQSHWSKGEPIIVNDVLSSSSGLSWEPMVLWRAFRDITKSGNHSYAYEVKAINCLDWSEVTVDLSKFCRGYSEAQFTKQGLPLILKLEDWKPSCLSQGEWPRHFVEFINCLPFKDYTNPHNGYLNVATKLPDLSSKPDMGPKMDIAYGDSVTKLHYEKSDTVNVLTHTKSGVRTSTKLNKTKIVKEKHGDQQETLVCNTGLQRNESQQNAVDPMDGGALWDIFQRQDVAKLEEYIRNHSAEFRHTDCLSVEQVTLYNFKTPSKLLSLVIITTSIDDVMLQVFHPIHDRTFYLNVEHKKKLKEEFGISLTSMFLIASRIEPLTFKQKLGDAVFIPAGCPYQVRNLKVRIYIYMYHLCLLFVFANRISSIQSCTKVELNFISPESLGECIRLQTELRMLPNNHIAKQQKLNIGKMMIYALDQAVSELSGFIDSNGPTDDLQDQFAKELEILNGMNMNNHTNGWISDSDSVIPPSVHQLAPNEDSGGDGMDINDYTDGWVCDSESEENSRYIRCVFPSLRPSLNHIVVHQSAATIEDPGTTEEEESVGLWQGNVIGQPGKKILQAVMHHYPETFQGVKIRSKPHWLSILKELHVFIKSFLETSVDALSEDHITSLEEDLSDFESFGFDLSWARKRVNIVKDLKFGNDPLRLELVVLEQSVAFLHKELVEANARLEKARLDYDRATYARNKKVDEMAHKFGAEYEDVLNGNLGFGMLPGY